MTSYQYDVIIIGTGIAGLTTAIKLAEGGLQVAIITREKDICETNTLYAQGGIIYPAKEDKDLVDDIYRASAHTANLAACEVLRERSGGILKEILLDKTKTDFARAKSGKLKYTKEGAHSISRVIYKGDYTGRAIEESFVEYIKDKDRFPNISIMTGHTAIDLLTPEHHGVSIIQRYEEDKILGVYVLNQETGKVIKVLGKVTVLATGGFAGLYLHHSNACGSRGDGHAMAKRAGAFLTNMEFIQFHPTTFFESTSHRRFLISEAVRGEGGILVNSDGKAFMENYHVDKELAPRDIVARAIMQETLNTKHSCVYLDITHKKKSWIKDRFPTIYQYCKERNVDITEKPIPVIPSAHYTCGGIKTDLKAKTSLENLYAVGEVACTGLHGANRLASTSLLEGLTWGYVAAEDIIKNIKNLKLYSADDVKNWEFVGNKEAEQALIHQDWLTLRQTMWNYVGLTRTEERLSRANAMFSELYDEIHRFYKNVYMQDELIGLRNAVEVAYVVQGASLRNKESVGCFYKEN